MGKNLKALKEKKNALIEEMTALADTVDQEVRSFNEAELSRISEIKLEVAGIDSTIDSVKEVRSLAKADIEDKDGGKQHMELEGKELEVRGMEQFLRGQYGEERRALTDANTTDGIGTEGGTAGQQGVTIPENVYGEIIELLGENAPVFEMARKFPSVTGNLKVAREGDQDDEGFIGETLDATKLKPMLKAVTLKQKRVAAALQLTNQLVNDSAVNIVDYSTRRLARSTAKAIERGILIGAKSGEDADDTFRPIVGNADVLTHNVAAIDALTVEEILDIYGTLNPGYLNGAAWIVSRAVFNKMLKLKDGDGTYLVFRTIVEGRPGYTLLGCPVYVSDVLKDNATSQVVFGNINEGYGMLIKKDMNLVAVTADTTQALAGGRLYVLDAYMDGAVVNPNAIVVAKKA